MRKADYAALATIIKKERDRALNTAATQPDIAPEARCVAAVCEAIASAFTYRASVDSSQFLRACGVTT